MVSTVARICVPALLTRMSMRPNASTALATKLPTASALGDVGDDADHARAARGKIGDGGVEARRVARADRDRAAFVQQRLRDGLADSARRTGDDCNLASQVEVHFPLVVILDFAAPRILYGRDLEASRNEDNGNGSGDQGTPRNRNGWRQRDRLRDRAAVSRGRRARADRGAHRGQDRQGARRARQRRPAARCMRSRPT